MAFLSRAAASNCAPWSPMLLPPTLAASPAAGLAGLRKASLSEGSVALHSGDSATSQETRLASAGAASLLLLQPAAPLLLCAPLRLPVLRMHSLGVGFSSSYNTTPGTARLGPTADCSAPPPPPPQLPALLVGRGSAAAACQCLALQCLRRRRRQQRLRLLLLLLLRRAAGGAASRVVFLARRGSTCLRALCCAAARAPAAS